MDYETHCVFYLPSHETCCVFYLPSPEAQGYKTHEFHNTSYGMKIHLIFYINNIVAAFRGDAGQSDPYVPLCFAGDTKTHLSKASSKQHTLK